MRTVLASRTFGPYRGRMEHLAELRTLIKRHARADMMVEALPGVAVMASSTTTEPIHHVYEPMLAVIAQGTKRTVLNDKVFEYRAGQYLVVSVDLPITGHVIEASEREPFLAMGMVLKPATIATLLLETTGGDRTIAESLGFAISQASPELLDPVVRLLRLLEHPEDTCVLAPMLEREILWRLLAGEQGGMVRQIGLADSRLSQISHAIRWIRSHYAETVATEDLAGLVSMSVSSFHRHFRAVTSMSPLQYQKRIRLQEARARLLAESGDVAAVGFEVGYDSPSQFSREYSRLFGAPPGRDVARLRSMPMLEQGIA
ncbi:AraC-like DNA-binding protein [Caballeronia udeis]|uniref:AraC-like DNA-binding protein n=2 Tax=Caballeronia udeis TaxID=1232866 RepID=A0ABW8MI98_9BURK